MKTISKTTFIITGLLTFSVAAITAVQEKGAFTICRVKYSGGGDWYSDPSSLPNLLAFIRKNTNIKVGATEARYSLKDEEIFGYPYLYITGHGNIRFSDKEVSNLRTFLMGGGFLHADDNYGMDESFRREMKRVFPNKEWVELPHDHPIYHCYYSFDDGLPKIHEHDGKPAQGLALFEGERMTVFYSYESDLGDGWEDPEVHDDPEEKHQAALRMGINIFFYALTQ